MSNLGYNFEIYIVEKLREFFKTSIERNSLNKVFRIIGSGRNKLATKSGQDTLLMGDVSIEIDSLPKNILIECKHRKSNAELKSFAIRKEWLDQARDEAEKISRWSIVAIRFKSVSPNSLELKKYSFYGVDSNAVHYILPEKHFLEILDQLTKEKGPITNLSAISTDDLIEEIKKRLK